MNRLRHYISKQQQFPHLYRRRLSSGLSTAEDVTETESATEVDFDRRFMNKSGLLAQHRNVLHEQRPYSEAYSWIHLTEKYQKRIFGRYGAKTNIDPRICFPRPSAAKSRAEQQRIAEPKSLQVMMKQLQEEEKLKNDIKMKRDEDISKNMEKLDLWTQELHNKVKKKEADALAVKQRKERLIEEVRRHFGYKVDPREERFKEMLEQKDRAERKKDKEARRQAKEAKMLTKLANTKV